MGLFLLVVLSTLAALAAVAATRRYSASRSERALAAGVVWAVLVFAPVHALGWTGALDRVTLPITAALLSLAVLAVSIAARSAGEIRENALDVVRAFADTATLPRDAFREALRDHGIAILALAAVAFVLAYTVWLAWLAPSSSWDGLWYHEPMVGFAIQNRGFSIVPVPTHLEWVNGYPRTSEDFMTWVVLLSDRRLIDAVPSFLAVLVLIGFYVIARRFTAWRAGAMGFAVVLLLVPGVVLQLRSTYVDVTVLAAFLASLHFTTRPDFRTRDVWLSALALAFVGGTKATGLYYVFLLGAAGLVSTIACCVRRRSASPLVHLLGATVLLVLLVAPSYLRNWSLHHNLFWPLKFELKALGIAWAGPSDLQDMQHPFDQVVHELFSAPSPGLDYHDTRVHGYGHALPFVALPLALIALFVAARDWLLASARGDARTARIASGLLVLTVLVAMSTAGSPAYWWARYQLQIGVAILLLVVWLVGRPRWVPFGQGVLGAMLFISLITLWWADPGWDAPFKTALELMRKTHAERVVTKMSHNVSPTETLIAREREIGDGDVVVINDDFSFIGNMWNERMSNRVVWVPFRTAADYKRRLDAVAAKWVIVRRGTGGERAIKNEALRWQRVGWGYEGYHDVYRRTSM